MMHGAYNVKLISEYFRTSVATIIVYIPHASMEWCLVKHRDKFSAPCLSQCHVKQLIILFGISYHQHYTYN